METVYHLTPAALRDRVPPLRRWEESVPVPLLLPAPAPLREAFLWSEVRTVTNTATMFLHGNTYQVGQLLADRSRAGLRPFDLTAIEVYLAIALSEPVRTHKSALPEDSIHSLCTGLPYHAQFLFTVACVRGHHVERLRRLHMFG